MASFYFFGLVFPHGLSSSQKYGLILTTNWQIVYMHVFVFIGVLLDCYFFFRFIILSCPAFTNGIYMFVTAIQNLYFIT